MGSTQSEEAAIMESPQRETGERRRSGRVLSGNRKSKTSYPGHCQIGTAITLVEYPNTLGGLPTEDSTTASYDSSKGFG